MARKNTYGRRLFLGAAARTVAAGGLLISGFAEAESIQMKPAEEKTIKLAAKNSFGPIKQVDAGLLNVGYAEDGPASGPAVILLHGWPYDIHSFVDVAPLLASQGYRVIVPYLRGFGATRFLASDTFRNGQPSVFALDT